MDTAQLLHIAEEAARTAGTRLLEGAEVLRTVTFEDRRDVKLQADSDSERYIRTLLARETADIPVIGEEEGGDASLTGQERLYWVVDPLDGTYNYSRGIEQCGVSIGLLRGESPVLGVIHDFYRNRTYSGAPGYGFFINGERTHYGWAPNREQAVLATGLPHGMDRSDANMVAYVRQMAHYKKIRMVGSAALAMAYVASGQMDVYHEQAIRLWDVAAGAALIQAAGGVLHMHPSPGGAFLAYDVWAAGSASFLPDSIQS